jgi:succinate dehydrogenase / fumarate reductase, cytochrome b subunit
MAEAKTGQGAKPARPLSPHLMIYSPPVSMVMSIVHRITGTALYAGTLILAWWLVAAATGPEYFGYVSGLLGTWPGKLVLVGYTWALIHHAMGGIRHFIWDTGRGFDLGTVDRLSWASIAVSVLLTVLIWALAIQQAGSA